MIVGIALMALRGSYMGDSVGLLDASWPTRNYTRAGLVTLTVMMALGASRLSQAADADATSEEAAGHSGLEEIVVTARKRTETLLDVPASITAISANTIEQAHMTQIDDIGSVVSNLNIFEAHDNTPAVTLRGVGAFELVQGVGFYVDDIQLFEGQTVRPVDIERIEVLKGPQGTLYGGANIGGAIKYVTKNPGDTWDNEAAFEYGEHDTRNYHAVLSGPLLPDGKLGVRVSLYDDTHGGYIYDTFRHIYFGDTHDKGGRLTLFSQFGDTKIHWYFSGDDLDSSNENLNYTTPDDHTYRYSIDDFYYPQYLRHLWSTTLQIDHQINPDIAFTSLSSFFSSYNRGWTDFAKRPVPIDYLQQNLDQRVATQELRLASTGRSQLDWIVGLFFEHHRSQPLTADNFSTGDVNNPIVIGTDLDVDKTLQRRFAAFGDVTYRVGDWQFELGAREEHYASNESAYNNSIQPPLSASANLTGNQFAPRVSAQYKFSPTLNVYSTIARGFQPAQEIEENGVIHPLKPEIATSYEVGFKSILDNVMLNAAVFFIDYQNRWYQTLRDFNGGLLDVTSNVGTSRNYGAEFDLTAPLAYGFKVSSGFGVTRAIWSNINYIDPATSQTINLNGRTAPYTPIYSGNVAVDWEHPVGAGLRVGARVDGTFTGRSYWDPQDSSSQNAYQLLNLGARLENDRFTLAAHVTNVTGTQYNSMYFPAVDVGTPYNFARIGRPRWYTVSLTVHF
jgi:iron complex outermembrane recepter protein